MGDYLMEPPTKKQCTETSRNRIRREDCLSDSSVKHSSTMEHRIALISPPISPETALQTHLETDIKFSTHAADPLLYPDDGSPDDLEYRLFTTSSRGQPVSGDLKIRVVQGSSLKSQVNRLYNKDSRQLLHFLRSEWMPRKSSLTKPPATSSNWRPTDTRAILRDRSGDRLENASTRHARTQNVQRRVASVTTNKSQDAKVAKKRVEDIDFEALQDFCPPLSELTNPKALRAEWPGNPIDLSNDPNRDMLDLRELTLASVLRLSCATYLCSKRRIFNGRVENLRIGKDFRKTDAQQACKIDVNKASKLWSAFDNAGWFRSELFTQYL